MFQLHRLTPNRRELPEASLEAGPKHFRLFAGLAKNVIRFRFLRSPFSGHRSIPDPRSRRGSFPASQAGPSYYAATVRGRASR